MKTAIGCLVTLFILVVVAVFVAGILWFGPTMGGVSDLALAGANSCSLSSQTLGGSIERRLGAASGSTETNGGMGHSSWRMPVRGDSGTGSLRWNAQKTGGSWTFVSLTLISDDGTVIDALSCMKLE